jgi:DNA polymerase-1
VLSPAFVAIDYILDSPSDAKKVAANRSHLVGMAVLQNGVASYHDDDFAAVLAGFGDRPRLYYDARLALAVELHNDLPSAPFDDVRAMLHLLQQPPPPALQAATTSLARVHAIQAIAPQLLHRIDAEGLARVYRDIELPVVIPTAVMLATGLRINRHVLRQIHSNQWARTERARRALVQYAGPRFNPDDNEAVQRLLYQDLGLPYMQETRHGNPATTKVALAHLDPHPAVGLLREYRDAKPAVDSAKAVLDALEGTVVRGNLDPLGTLTGRYSCSDPPLQALDARVRKAIEAAPGCLLLEADYSQMELRVLAHLSQDPALLHAFEHGIDLHIRTAARVLGIAEDSVNDQQRQLGKTLNFGIVYGQTALGLATDLTMPLQRAQALLDAHAEAYPGVAAWIARVHEHVANNGEVRTLYGRRRYLPNIFSASANDVAEARRQAVNTIIQGTAADLLKLSLIRLHTTLHEEVHMLLPVHDSVLFQVREPLVERTRQIVTDAMESLPEGFSVPLEVKLKTGKTWVDCKPVSAVTC